MKALQSGKISALTGLRVFAAASIFLWHCVGYFLPKEFFQPFHPEGAVPFFFVLSGFILVIAGSRSRSYKQFFISRIARIWPAHMATIILLFAVFWPWSLDYFKSAESVRNLALNILLVQGWFPQREIWSSYNSVSWSISVEMFFYAAFPVLFYFISLRPLMVTAIIATLILSTMLVVPIIFPGIDPAWLGSLSPIAGLWAFTTGMLIGAFATRKARAPQLSTPLWTFLEICAVAFALFANYYAASGIAKQAPEALREFVQQMGPAPAYAALILVMAYSKGYISWMLSRRTLVYLGEVSFAFYLVHQIVIRWYGDNASVFADMGLSYRFTIVTFASLIISIAIYHCVEIPTRRLIVRKLVNSNKAKVTNSKTGNGDNQKPDLVTL